MLFLKALPAAHRIGSSRSERDSGFMMGASGIQFSALALWHFKKLSAMIARRGQRFPGPPGYPGIKCAAEAADRKSGMIVTLFKTGKDGRLLYYSIHDRQQTLSDPYTLTSAWRTGNGKEREKHYSFDCLAHMDTMIRSLLSRRIKAGYKLLYSFSRDARWSGDHDELAAQASAAGAPSAGRGGLLAKAKAARDLPAEITTPHRRQA